MSTLSNRQSVCRFGEDDFIYHNNVCLPQSNSAAPKNKFADCTCATLFDEYKESSDSRQVVKRAKLTEIFIVTQEQGANSNPEMPIKEQAVINCDNLPRQL